MKGEKSGVTRTSYAPDFKADIIRMLISGKRVSEIALTHLFGVLSALAVNGMGLFFVDLQFTLCHVGYHFTFDVKGLFLTPAVG